jgi:hypothetical protein
LSLSVGCLGLCSWLVIGGHPLPDAAAGPAQSAGVLAPLLTDGLAVDDAIVALRGYSQVSPPVGCLV